MQIYSEKTIYAYGKSTISAILQISKPDTNHYTYLPTYRSRFFFWYEATNAADIKCTARACLKRRHILHERPLLTKSMAATIPSPNINVRCRRRITT
jgi:hypothetical protein